MFLLMLVCITILGSKLKDSVADPKCDVGVACHDRFVEDKLDDNGDLLPPDMKTLDINLTGCLYTCRLGLHYIGKNGAKGGSVVITASVSSESISPSPSSYGLEGDNDAKGR